jgi:hypothetical protein
MCLHAVRWLEKNERPNTCKEPIQKPPTHLGLFLFLAYFFLLHFWAFNPKNFQISPPTSVGVFCFFFVSSAPRLLHAGCRAVEISGAAQKPKKKDGHPLGGKKSESGPNMFLETLFNGAFEPPLPRNTKKQKAIKKMWGNRLRFFVDYFVKCFRHGFFLNDHKSKVSFSSTFLFHRGFGLPLPRNAQKCKGGKGRGGGVVVIGFYCSVLQGGRGFRCVANSLWCCCARHGRGKGATAAHSYTQVYQAARPGTEPRASLHRRSHHAPASPPFHHLEPRLRGTG